MSKKSNEVVDPRVAHEQAWAWEAFHARLTFPQMRALAIRPPSEGGLGYPVSLSGVKALVLAARAANGDLTMGREERIERQDAEIDMRTRLARHDLEAGYRELAQPRPTIDEAGYDVEIYRAQIAAYHSNRTHARQMIESADKRLEVAMRNERDLHGLNAPTRIDADITTHDGVMDDLNAALVALGRDPVEVVE